MIGMPVGERRDEHTKTKDGVPVVSLAPRGPSEQEETGHLGGARCVLRYTSEYLESPYGGLNFVVKCPRFVHG